MGPGPELVVVPGLGALGYLRPALEAAAAVGPVRLLDVPGFGATRTSRCPSSLDDVSGTVAAWLGTGPTSAGVVLVGHSTGAQAALRAALAAPDRVRALVLAGITFPPAARAAGPLVGRTLRTVRHERPRELAAVLPEYVRGGRRLGRLLRTALADRPEDAVRAVAVPLVVVRGRHDHLCDGAWAEHLAATAPDGRVVELPGAHNTSTTHPEQTAEAWWGALR
ncbi:MAG: alpha/beta fold hydrolase [Actinomycetes bacterium]